MSLKNKALILFGIIIVAFVAYKYIPNTDPVASPNTYTLLFFDKTLSNTATYGTTEIESHRNVIMEASDNLKVKGDKVKAYYIDAITESASNRVPDAELDFDLTLDSNAGYLDQQNAQKEYNRNLFVLKKEVKTNLLQHFEEEGNSIHINQTDAWGILNKIKLDADKLNTGDRMEVLIFSDMEESMNTAGRRDFHKNKINTIDDANRLADEDINTIKQLYSFNTIKLAENIKVRLYFPSAKEGKAKMEAYWIKIFNGFNIDVELI
ncbi:hypothetical protein K3G39_06995 [Pontibacter sp. HSC-14F20]|uniref:hypothetical protein n=1 Tax=Pontibacter sp. HSC-14F20 TaxID=2864136 RepID=UPI001C7315E8|nr:hypothetical protein [Pontibacter sp. HSC-14F20]MBX0332980.1 hypothetical protein [Pontibacter sp. HSC-14F20]